MSAACEQLLQGLTIAFEKMKKFRGQGKSQPLIFYQKPRKKLENEKNSKKSAIKITASFLSLSNAL
ncbi:MAG: hypothetical protein M3209_10970 [Acidobacteriota bacterium]|nr:hypothetical protein [Acidobacteriota bacterium]